MYPQRKYLLQVFYFKGIYLRNLENGRATSLGNCYLSTRKTILLFGVGSCDSIGGFVCCPALLGQAIFYSNVKVLI